MTEQDFNQTTSHLRDLLMQERGLLLSGRAREAAELVQSKLDATERMESYLAPDGEGSAIAAAHRREIEEIVKLAKENSAHFEAIRNGLRHAIERLETMHANAYVGSYGQDGAKLAFSGVAGSYLRKA
ncbi:MAG: hypothetical protein KDA53_11230 [Hyphomonas sp.]|nr:hypothetical protein [Hyphomonas sp.]